MCGCRLCGGLILVGSLWIVLEFRDSFNFVFIGVFGFEKVSGVIFENVVGGYIWGFMEGCLLCEEFFKFWGEDIWCSNGELIFDVECIELGLNCSNCFGWLLLFVEVFEVIWWFIFWLWLLEFVLCKRCVGIWLVFFCRCVNLGVFFDIFNCEILGEEVFLGVFFFCFGREFLKGEIIGVFCLFLENESEGRFVGKLKLWSEGIG